MKKYLTNNFDYRELVDLYDEVPLWSAPFGLKLLEFIDYRPNITALDIGFGTGFPLTEVAMRLGEGATVYGIDPWIDIFTRTNRKIKNYGISNIKLIEGIAEEIPFGDGFIDLIVSNNGMNNVNDLEKSVSECSRVLKKGGQFVMTMNLDKSMFEFYNQLEVILSELKMEKEIEKMRQHIYQKRRPLDEIIRLINQNGFTIKDMEHDQFDYRFSNASAMFNHYFIRLAFMESWVKLLPADKVEYIFDNIETRLNQKAKEQGVLKLSIPFVAINSIKN